MDTAILDDILECAVCFRTLDENNKALPCQHTFCKPCLEAIVAVQKELRCPECRVLINKSIDELPPNVLLIRLLDGLKNQQKLLSNTDSLRDAAAQKRHSVEGILSEPGSAGNSKNKSNENKRAGHERMHSNPETLMTAVSSNSSKQPSAKATFAYTSNHEGDLNLKKGDKILLLRWVDNNWLVGECGGRTGLFPANHVDILVPLPDEKPYCRALYDFKSTDHEKDRDCLIFNKDDTIYVLRRVDQNWGEGILNDEIGIFPLSFVKMNTSAKKLIEEMSKPNPTPTSSSTSKYHQHNRSSNNKSSESSSSSRGGSFFGAAARRIANSRHGSKNEGKQRHSFPLFGFGGSSGNNNPTTSNHPSNSSGGVSSGENGKKDDKLTHRHSMELDAIPPVPPTTTTTSTTSCNKDDVENTSPDEQQVSGNTSERKQHTKANSYEAPSQRVRTSIAGKQWLFTPPNQQQNSKSSSGKCDWNHYNKQQQQDQTSSTRNKTSRQLSNDGNVVVGTPPCSSSCHPPPLQLMSSSQQSNIPLPPSSPSCIKQPSPPPRPPRSMRLPTSPPLPSYHHNSESTTNRRNSRGRSVSPRPNNVDTTTTSSSQLPTSHDFIRSKPHHTQRSKSAQRRTSKDKKREKAMAAAAASSGGNNNGGGNLLYSSHGNKKTRASSSSSSPFYYELNLTNSTESPTTQQQQQSSSSNQQHTRSSSSRRSRDRYYAVMSYPANGPDELDLHEGDVIVVHERRMDGWFCGTHLRSGKIGHFPATFVERIPTDE